MAMADSRRGVVGEAGVPGERSPLIDQPTEVIKEMGIYSHFLVLNQGEGVVFGV